MLAALVVAWAAAYPITIELAPHVPPPVNEFLARSPWPVAHHDSYSQGSTAMDSVTLEDVLAARVDVDFLFDRGLSGTLSIFWADERSGVAWGSSIYAIYKIDTAATPMRVIDAVRKPPDLVAKDTFRGIYSVVSAQGVFYTTIGNKIFAVTSEPGPIGETPIKPLGAFVLEQLVQPNESFISLNMLYSGHLAFCTNKGLVGVVTTDLKHLLALGAIAKHPQVNNAVLADPQADVRSVADLEISNAMTIDENNALYVLSSEYLHRLIFDARGNALIAAWPLANSSGTVLAASRELNTAEFTQPGPTLVWATPYKTDPGPLPNRLSSKGSGSSPSVLRHPTSDHLFICITDGQYRQELNVFDAFTGQLVAAAPVDFGVPRSRNESYTEQSVLVYRNEMVVVQNALSPTGKRLNQMLTYWNAAAMVKNASERFTKHIHLTPVVLGDASRGLQKFALVPRSGGGWALKPRWSTLDYGCPNSIPTMSGVTGLIYCVSKGTRGRVANEATRLRDLATRSLVPAVPTAMTYPEGFNGVWTVAGIDFATGDKLFDVKIGSDIRYNSLYSAVQIGPLGEIVYGSMGGLVRVRAQRPPQRKRLVINLPKP